MLRKNNTNHKNGSALSSLSACLASSKPQLIQSVNLTPENSNNTSSSSISFNRLSTPKFSINLNPINKCNRQKSNSKTPNMSPGKQNMYFSFNPLNYSTNNFNYTKESFNKNNKSLHKNQQNQERFAKKQNFTKYSSILNSCNTDSFFPNCKFSLESTIKSPTGSRNQSIQKNSIENCKQLIIGPKITQEQNIKVYIRFKPTDEEQMPITLVNSQVVQIQEKNFIFDQLYCGSQQKTLYQQIGRPIVDKVFLGFNGTIFAYGQTGSGKTHTIFGQAKEQGLIPRAIKQIYQRKGANKRLNRIKCTLVQIYKEELIDLFDVECKSLKLKQTKKQGVYVQNLKEISSKNSQQLIQIIYQSSKNRRVGSTKINEKSSRSHTILTLILQFDNFASKLSLIDLAGSQKVRKSGVTGQSLQETKKINYSLSCLGNVINALTTRNNTDHIPFRDSKLTRILKDSLSGSFLTSIIVTCSMDKQSLNQTVSSLKFAERAKKVKLLPSNSLQNYSLITKKGQSIEYLHNVIKQLSHNLEETKKQLNRYKERPEHQEISEILFERCQTQGDVSSRIPIPSQRAHVAQKISKYTDNRIGMLQSKRSSTCSYMPSNCSQMPVSSGGNRPKLEFQKATNCQAVQAQTFSLNVSNTMLDNHDMISPNMSGLYQNQEQIASQISFSFSVLNREDFGFGGTSRQNSKRTVRQKQK